MLATTRHLTALAAATLVAAPLAATVITAVPAPASAQPAPRLDPGSTYRRELVIHTPVIPAKPDVVLVVDTTASMGGALANVAANLRAIIDAVRASQPSAHFAIATYRDVGDGPALFQIAQPLTDDSEALQAAVARLTVGGGQDTPEAWINALFQLGTGAIAWRPNSHRVAVLIGDASSHDPSGGHQLSDATAALTAADISVLAVNVDTGGADGLDATGQASTITDGTDGQLVTAVPGAVAEAIVAGLRGGEVTVAPQPASCDDGMSVTLDDGAQTVPGGSYAVYATTIVVSNDAPQGRALHCRIPVRLVGQDGPAQLVLLDQAVRVTDVTPPQRSCTAVRGVYRMSATDNHDPRPVLYLRDTGDPTVNFGPYPSGTTFRLRAAGPAGPASTPGAGVDHVVALTGDPQVAAGDAAGNISTTTVCDGSRAD